MRRNGEAGPTNLPSSNAIIPLWGIWGSMPQSTVRTMIVWSLNATGHEEITPDLTSRNSGWAGKPLINTIVCPDEPKLATIQTTD
ncbi:hypothetical protein VTH06DRAFT_809 [Thermothelomyces fergusii]